ncbi:hypothetical protein [Sinorhizobium meliloti]|uniref:hypothetical protein n=1 Tax=Rhizobium meliloti TaxID=382 RepID=UPI001313ED36|nr:hypothetical protein [Sinorhizobium meliloti]
MTPIGDVITALQAAEIAIEDAVSLLPSLLPGVHIENSSINVRSLSQESPLRELFALTLIVAFQDDLKTEIPPMIEKLFDIRISEQYDSIVTVATMIVLFYGAALLKDAAVKTLENGALRRQVDALLAQMSEATGMSEERVRAIFDAKYSKPGPVKRLAKAVRGFFVPTQREGGVSVIFDRNRVHRDVIREVPYPQEFKDKEDFEKYTPKYGATLEIHAQDKDKINTGWAAVPRGITDRRLRMKLVEPVMAPDLWNRDHVTADIIVVSKLTADGYVPSEIQITKILD